MGDLLYLVNVQQIYNTIFIYFTKMLKRWEVVRFRVEDVSMYIKDDKRCWQVGPLKQTQSATEKQHLHSQPTNDKCYLILHLQSELSHALLLHPLSFCYVLAWPPGICTLRLSSIATWLGLRHCCHLWGSWHGDEVSRGSGVHTSQKNILSATMQLTVGWELNKYSLSLTSFDGRVTISALLFMCNTVSEAMKTNVCTD